MPPASRPLPAVRPAIVFLHGTRLTGAQWTPQVAAVGDRFRCFAPDLPGHGTAAGEVFRLDRAAEQVAQLIDSEAGGRAIVVGLSLGGYVAMDVAARWPDRVAGLVLAGATAEPLGRRALLYRGLSRRYASDERGLHRFDSWFFRWRYPPEIAEPIIAAGFHFPGGAAAIRSLVGEEFRPRLRRYPGPSLILNGEYDLLFRWYERSFVDVAADPRRRLIRRATHLSNLDKPAQFSAAVLAFAERVAMRLEAGAA